MHFSFSFSYTAAFGLQVMAYLQYRIINKRFPNNDIHIFQIKKSKLKIEKVLLFCCVLLVLRVLSLSLPPKKVTKESRRNSDGSNFGGGTIER